MECKRVGMEMEREGAVAYPASRIVVRWVFDFLGALRAILPACSTPLRLELSSRPGLTLLCLLPYHHLRRDTHEHISFLVLVSYCLLSFRLPASTAAACVAASGLLTYPLLRTPLLHLSAPARAPSVCCLLPPLLPAPTRTHPHITHIHLPSGSYLRLGTVARRLVLHRHTATAKQFTSFVSLCAFQLPSASSLAGA